MAHEASPARTGSAPEPTAADAMLLEGVDPVLRTALEMEASRWGLSLNAFILQILHESLGLAGPASLCHDIDALAGVWSLREAEELTETIMYLERTEGRPDGSNGERSPA